ncbi:MAG: amidohydrolase family protein [Sphingopyxis granuli]|uniref:amidohydrolase family protein n=1 Tax=Sphingopyxis granuli TaxID=267128 RepID=UPI003C7446D9
MPIDTLRRIARYLTGLAAAVLVTAPAVAQSPAPDVVALVGGAVVDVENGRVIEDAVVVIEGERIVQLGPRGRLQPPPGARIVPVDGRWLIPGLMNMHVHFGLKLPGTAGAELQNETDAQQALRMAHNARLSLRAGVTSVRLVSEIHGNDFALRRAIDRGEAVGPRIETAGELIVPTGGHGFLEVDGAYAFAQAARRQISQGASWIKIAISGGISDTHGAIAAAPMTNDELSVLIDVAHRNGVRVTAHNGSPEAAMQALTYGIDGFEHGYHLTEPVLRRMAKDKVWLVPTIVVSQPGARAFYQRIGSPDWYLQRVDSVGRDHWAMLQSAIRLGVPIALGTDQFPFEDNEGTTATVREAELYVDAGMTPLQALQAATIQPARMMRRDADIGSIAVGKYADIVLVDADPTRDIRALRSIDFVMKGGQVVRDDHGLSGQVR